MPNKVHDFNDSDLNNIHKHEPTDPCYDDQGYPYDCND